MADLLSEKLGIAPLEEPIKIKSNTSLVITNTDDLADNDLAIDYAAARQNLYNIMAKSLEAVDLMLEITKQSQHPRSAEVLGQLLKIAADNNDKLLGLQHQAQKLQQALTPTSPELSTNSTFNIDKAVFTGTTTDLLKILRPKTLLNTPE
ncbi:MAG: terminase small subunit [Candidatus Dormibacteria bacterium]